MRIQLSPLPDAIRLKQLIGAASVSALSHAALAQTSPFETGATALQTNLVTIATPIAIVLVMVLGIAAAVGRISWGWPIMALVGIGIIFAAPQIVTWARGLFGA
jgi:type IV secretory pathway VirB2 component (pilin)